MSNSSALASLTATYTDSEGEEDTNDEDNDLNNSNTENTTSSPTLENKSTTSSVPTSPVTAPVRVTTKVAKLVSYHDDTIASEDETETDENMPPHEVILITDEKPIIENETLEDDGDLIPPEPPGHCSLDLQDKIAKFYEKIKNKQVDMNVVIEQKKEFRNPSIYEKLLQLCAINELGTNYPPSIYDPQKWSKESYYDELAKVQKAEIEKRGMDRKNKDLAQGLKKDDESKKRKSKWDQPGGNGPQNVKPAGLIQPPSLTTNITGTKSTVLSAFGSLPKKPRP